LLQSCVALRAEVPRQKLIWRLSKCVCHACPNCGATLCDTLLASHLCSSRALMTSWAAIGTRVNDAEGP
jgi:hypothetical protein